MTQAFNERVKAVLCAVVQSYIDTSVPVGSRFVTKRFHFNLSPATIRNVMADLEETGFLSQPHTSAGRVPTDKGYRVYVDCLCEECNYGAGEFLTTLEKRIDAIKSDLNLLLNEVTNALSLNSHYLVFASTAKAEMTTLNRIQLFKYRKDMTAAVVLTNEGLIKSRVMDIGGELSQKDLNRLSDYLNSEFSGRSVSEIRLRLQKQMSMGKALYDIIISKALEICREALNYPKDDIVMAGVSKFLGLPDFANRVKEIAKAVEDKRMLIGFLDRLSSTDGIQVLIGSENPFLGPMGLSMVFANYKQSGRTAGGIGIIGPTRMDYLRAIPMVEIAAESISSALSER